MFSRAIFGFSRCTWPKIALPPPSPKLMTTFSFKLDKILAFQLVYCVGGSLKNLCHFQMGCGGLANADVIRGGGGGGHSMLTVADRGRCKFAKILLTSYVNAP